MCLLVLAYGVDPARPIVLAANRDEQYARPSAALGAWPDEPEICAGRDLSRGGTWLGLTRHGRFGALTNFRRGGPHAGARSRGEVVLEYLRSSLSPERYAQQLAGYAQELGGFSVIVGDLEHAPFYFSNRGGESGAVTRRLAPGLYGLSNQWLDDPWPKVTRAKDRIGTLLAGGDVSAEALCDAMVDLERPPDEALPDTGVGVELERVLSPIFIAGEHYGTRAVTALIVEDGGRAQMYERSYGPRGRYLSDARVELEGVRGVTA